MLSKLVQSWRSTSLNRLYLSFVHLKCCKWLLRWSYLCLIHIHYWTQNLMNRWFSISDAVIICSCGWIMSVILIANVVWSGILTVWWLNVYREVGIHRFTISNNHHSIIFVLLCIKMLLGYIPFNFHRFITLLSTHFKETICDLFDINGFFLESIKIPLPLTVLIKWNHYFIRPWEVYLIRVIN